MNILQVNTFDYGGGAEKIALNLHQETLRQGHTSHLAVGAKKTTESNVVVIPNNSHRNMVANGFCTLTTTLTAHCLPGASFAPYLTRMAEPQRLRNYRAGIEDFDYPATANLLSILPQQPDILHAHNLHGDYFDLRALPVLSQQVPFVLTLHDAWLLSGHCAHSFSCERWQTGCGRCPDLTIYPAIRHDATADNWRRKRNIFAHSKLYIATPSRWLMDKVDHSILQPAVVEAQVIPNGVDLSVFVPGDKALARRELGLPQDARIALFVGHGTRTNRWKDYDMLERAIEGVARHPCTQRLVFVCLGEKGKDKHIGPASIRFVGHQNDPVKVAQFYQASDVYLHAAHADTFPNTVIEALACGVPVVATAVGGIPEQVADEETGFLVAPGDDGAMAARTRQLIEDAALQRSMAEQAVASARQRFDARRMTRDYLQWYEDILTRGRQTLSLSHTESATA